MKGIRIKLRNASFYFYFFYGVALVRINMKLRTMKKFIFYLITIIRSFNTSMSFCIFQEEELFVRRNVNINFFLAKMVQ